jgi:hypothetical protein
MRRAVLRTLHGLVRLGLLLAVRTSAQEIALPPPGSDAWRPLAFPRIERHTRYTPATEDGRPILRAESACAASGLLTPLAADLARTPLLRWRWRVDEALSHAGERTRAGDDFAARVYVAFPFEPAHASVLERARRRLAAAVYGEEMPGTSLTYVWSSREPQGARWPNPFTASARMIVATSGTPRGWVDVEVDLVADFERSFSRAPPPPLFLALMTDSDGACGHARASYGDFRLAPRP